jgi:hypothetical protein
MNKIIGCTFSIGIYCVPGQKESRPMVVNLKQLTFVLFLFLSRGYLCCVHTLAFLHLGQRHSAIRFDKHLVSAIIFLDEDSAPDSQSSAESGGLAKKPSLRFDADCIAPVVVGSVGSESTA